MKKYIIKYADGRDCREINSYKSRNEASDALIKYIYSHNEYLSVNDDNYLSPFDFIIKEIDVKDVNEVITDYASAVKAIKKKTYFHNNRIACNFKHTDALSALNKLFTIAQAWNMEDDFVPDFSNEYQGKWFPWFRYDMKLEKFVCSSVICSSLGANAYWGSRLCFKTYDRAKQFGKQFENLYNEVFL